MNMRAFVYQVWEQVRMRVCVYCVRMHFRVRNKLSRKKIQIFYVQILTSYLEDAFVDKNNK